MSTMAVKAPAISCGHCVKTIQNEVAELKGVKNVVADQNTKLVTINFDDPATKEQVEALMAEIGYPVEK